jgi:hypothetical protein
MRLQNVTMVVLRRTANSGLAVAQVVRNPLVAVDPATKRPVFGPLARRLMSVAEVAKATGLSRNKAQEALRLNPLAYCVEFDAAAPAVAA